MCDYSLQGFKSRPATIGDKLVVHDFGTGTRGFAEAGGAKDTAVCVLPGTEIAFDKSVDSQYGSNQLKRYNTAIFRQINKKEPHRHHDCLEFPDGDYCLLTFLVPGQKATVLQLPAGPKTKAEAEEQRRAEFIG